MDKNNHLFSQWNAYGEPDENGHFKSSPPKNGFTHDQESQIVNGNSVNYAEKAEGQNNLHKEYDSSPVKMYDSEIRANIKKWVIPGTDPSSPDYFNIKESENEADRRMLDENKN